MKAGPPEFDFLCRLEGWNFLWAGLSCLDGAPIPGLLQEVYRSTREGRNLASLPEDPTVGALRRLFKAAGTDPSRYRPSSEALLRRVLKGDDPPPIHALVDLNNCLSLELACPCCVMAEGSFTPPFEFRAGHSGEGYLALKGPFGLEGKPLLVDAQGPLDAPITGSERAKVRAETRRAWLVAYLPEAILPPARAFDALQSLCERAPAVQIDWRRET